MAKSITINTSHTYTSKGVEMTVAEALEWIETHTSGEDEEGESTGPKYTAGDLVCYAVRRMMALAKDTKRISKGKAPSRIYTPRVAEVGDAAKNAATVKAEAREALARALHVTIDKEHATKKAPAGSRARGAQVKAKHEAKQAAKASPAAKPAPKAKGPAVRKGAALKIVKADEGGAKVEF